MWPLAFNSIGSRRKGGNEEGRHTHLSFGESPHNHGSYYSQEIQARVIDSDERPREVWWQIQVIEVTATKGTEVGSIGEDQQGQHANGITSNQRNAH